MKDEIGNRMKQNYENRYRSYLTRRTPVIMRLDGKSFHTLTRNLEKPFDKNFSNIMANVSVELCKEIQGAKCAYTQSDEISILITDFDNLTTEAWFDYNIQKMCSVSSGIASVVFSKLFYEDTYDMGVFDSRVFNIPESEVCNYFIWRQKDWIRNSLQMFARSFFSQSELHGKNHQDIHEMLHEKGENWTNLEQKWKNGIFICRDEDDKDWAVYHAPIFNDDRELINSFIKI